MLNYYSVLGLSESATQEEIKAAFKKLALKYHPDKNQGDTSMEERFKEVNHAYQVLSNAYEKARYDIQLMYGRSQQSFYQAPQQEEKIPPRPRYRRPVYSEPKIDWKENWIATAYAFGFTFVVASLVMIAISIKRYVDEQEMKKLLSERREIFESVKGEYALGNVELALTDLNRLGAFMPSEEDMVEYKTSLYESFIFNGESNFNKGAYEEAVFYFELIEGYSPSKPLPIKQHLAIAYKETNQPYKAIKLLKELMIYKFKSLEVYVTTAEIYRDQLKSYEEALRYFELGDRLAVKTYESIYGKGYPLVMEGKFLPPVHYDLYSGLADIYLRLNKPELAVKSTRWNINIWPDSIDNYLTAAKGFEVLKNTTKACEHYQIAKGLGYDKTIPHNCN